MARLPHYAVPDDIGEYFRYDEATGKLFWTKDSGQSNLSRVGDEAGATLRRGYVYLMFRGIKHPAHHVIWFIKTGRRAGMIDHRDGNPSNNLFENLREATTGENVCNRRGWSGRPKGAYPNRSGRFVSTISVAGVRHHLGIFDTAEQAHAAYVSAAIKLHGEFARTE